MEQEEIKELEEIKLKTGLCYAVDIQLAIEKLRVASQVRNSHLARNNRVDPFCTQAFVKLKELENWIDSHVSKEVENHSAYHWFSRVKGIGKENIGKVIGSIEIDKAPYVSSLWKYAGMHVVDGHSPRPVPGQKLEYNSELRTMVWRLASSLMRAKGKYYAFYLEKKVESEQKLLSQGIKVLPESELKPLKKEIIEKYLKLFGVKKQKDLPMEAQREIQRNPIPGHISEGQVHNRALRKMSKLFLSHLWLIMREAEELPVNKPYAQEVLGHQHYIDPWSMTDK